MPRSCTVCRHPECQALETRLLAGAASMRAVALGSGLSPSAVRRHMANHLPTVLLKAHESERVLHAGTLSDHIRELYQRSGLILKNAETAGDARTALAAVRELRGIIDLVARLTAKDSSRVNLSAVEALI